MLNFAIMTPTLNVGYCLFIFASSDNFIYETIFTRFIGTHKVITLSISCDPFFILAGVFCHKHIKSFTYLYDFISLNLNIRRLDLVLHHWADESSYANEVALAASPFAPPGEA